MVKVAVAQFAGHIDREVNLHTAVGLATEAAKEGAAIIAFPELANSIYFCHEYNPEYFRFAEPIDGPSLQRMRAMARDLRMVIVFPFYELDDGQRYNTAAVIGPDGELIGRYRKNSIPVMPRRDGSTEEPSDEKFFFTPSQLGFPVFPTPFGVRVGILICYDRHFPEAARLLGLRGADVVFVPTASFRPWIREVWEIELRAHAIANNYYVGGVNKVGLDVGGSPGRYHFGSSLFIDPKGQVLVRAGDKHDEIIYADVDLKLIDTTRDQWGFFRNRRPEAYAALAEPTGDATRQEPERARR